MNILTFEIRSVLLLSFLLFAVFALPVHSQGHPNLILTKAGVDDIRNNLGRAPLFDVTLQRAKEVVDAEMALGIDTPIPKDFSGGYTHQRHKRNYAMAQQAGVLFQILEDETYAQYVRDMLFQYEAMYKGLPLHPQERSYARGKLFWQCLNESNWLVYMSQAYDAIYEWLPADERQQLEDNLFRPVADFISLENPQFYNRVHNHSTWGSAAVGMIGLVMDDDELIARAMYGIEDDGLEVGLRDDDGGVIKKAGQKAGFLANLEEPFSPDGYYTEGPYYQRYAMYPFLIFALGLHNAKPEMQILEYGDGVLLKAVDALLNLSDADGEFFPLNDAQKGMSYYSRELVTAVDIAYRYGGRDTQLLSIAKKQNHVLLDEAGLAVALGVEEGKAEPFRKQSVNLSDGPNGKQGGVSVLRAGNEDLTLVFKYAAQGLSHGHYDKLSFSLYEKGDEVLQDYGLVRFVNIGQKGGGNYLPENTTWAKHTIAHNTLVQNEESHFDADYLVGSQHHSDLHFYDDTQNDIKIVSAREHNAYPGTQMLRTMSVISDPELEKPFLLDVLKVTSDSKNQYDLPFYYMGQVLESNFDYDTPSSLRTLGEKNGYQHLFVEGRGKAAAGSTQFSWLGNNKFYTLTTATAKSDNILLTRLGANDPDFNLRRDAALMIRRKKANNTVFATVIEPHGSYSPVSEFSANPKGTIAAVEVIYDDEAYTAVTVAGLQNGPLTLIIANANAATDTEHTLDIASEAYRWTGPYYFRR